MAAAVLWLFFVVLFALVAVFGMSPAMETGLWTVVGPPWALCLAPADVLGVAWGELVAVRGLSHTSGYTRGLGTVRELMQLIHVAAFGRSAAVKFGVGHIVCWCSSEGLAL